jgi:hypothetical protein
MRASGKFLKKLPEANGGFVAGQLEIDFSLLVAASDFVFDQGGREYRSVDNSQSQPIAILAQLHPRPRESITSPITDRQARKVRQKRWD